MDPTRESTYEFLDAFIGEMAALFPDPFFHIGGDEVTGKQWKGSARIRAFMRKNRLEDHRGVCKRISIGGFRRSWRSTESEWRVGMRFSIRICRRTS